MYTNSARHMRAGTQIGTVQWVPPSGVSITKIEIMSGILAAVFVDVFVIANLPLTPIHEIIPALAAIDAIGAGIFMYIISTDPYLIGVGADGVVFLYHFRKQMFVPWESIRPPTMKTLWGWSSVFIPSIKNEGVQIEEEWYRSTNLKPNQVVEIVTHPNFRYPIKPAVAESLGLVPTPDGRYVKAR